MRVAQINSVCGQGSTGRITVELSEMLSNNGINNHIYYGVGTSEFKSSTKFSSDLYVKYNILKTRLFGKHSFYSKTGTKRLIKFLKNYQPDVIHLHQPHGHYINIKLLINFINEHEIPLVLTLHDCWIFTGHCVHFTVANCEKWKTGCGGCPQLKQYPKSLIFDRTAESFRDKNILLNSIKNVSFVAISDWIYSISKQSMIKNQKVFKIYNGIDTKIFLPKNVNYLRSMYDFQSKFVVLGMANKWITNNNTSNLSRFMEKMDDDVVFVLIGVTPDQKASLPRNVFGVERISDINKLADFYSLADVFVNLSYEDSFGLVSAEALSCGTPVVAYNSTACGEIVGNDNCGKIVSLGNFDDVISAVKHIKMNGKSYYTQNCRERVLAMYDKDNTYREYLNLYNSLLGKNTSRK